MQRRHVVITGTGRAGTTFLVEVLTRAGLDTGFDEASLALAQNAPARAGLETDIRRPDAPYVVKSPGFCGLAASVLERQDIRLDHVFIPMRELYDAAESRRDVMRRTMAGWPPLRRLRQRLARRSVAGGLWGTRSLDTGEQERRLTEQLQRLMLALSRSMVPVTLLHYPTLVTDDRYLYSKLAPVLGPIGFAQFQPLFARTARPDFVHEFARPRAEPVRQRPAIGAGVARPGSGARPVVIDG